MNAACTCPACGHHVAVPFYDGGRQERQLAEKYRAWADQVRDEWPRAGKLLDLIVKSYEADGRREDGSAERQLRR